MKLFIDSINIEEIRKIHSIGILDGVTTNPSLASKIKIPYKKAIQEICGIISGHVSAEVLATETDNMIKEAEELCKIAKNVVIKVPLTENGLKAVNILHKRNIKTNVTLCFSSTQALLAAKAGATYISPFVGRIDDISYNGMEIIKEIRLIYNNYDLPTEILAASIRNPIHVKLAAMFGADVATIPYGTFLQLMKHPLTDIGLDQFLKDSKKMSW